VWGAHRVGKNGVPWGRGSLSSVFWKTVLWTLEEVSSVAHKSKHSVTESHPSDMKRGETGILLYTKIKLFIEHSNFAFWSILQLETIPINQD